ncbi:hypothetical protein H257_12114 [Aphanomyces astaci]|uniref:Integrase catalytic domain-containing protein n=1 Tax=Aphanomyces astaci TaxID=112090 RepID=W4G2D7_APHAT|nr:hypothetical protein H257_12114 [Aphanomyces astaci]ETV73078.1 hypothetical protein H257_12114 [Aphanomyces astaci]|eukprot:XP_009837527.1 hypothetical protein H257_12114 [Aphanomyces astaci]
MVPRVPSGLRGRQGEPHHGPSQFWLCQTFAAFFVVCDASIRAIGCCLMQRDDSGRDRPVSFQSRQLHKSEKNYPVHDLELLAMYYALKKFRVYLLGSEEFVVFTDHASLRTAVHSPHLSQRMQRWLSFFSEFNMKVEYKPGRDNVVADALSRLPPVGRQHGALLHLHAIVRDGLLLYSTNTTDCSRIAVPCDYSLRQDILHELHDAPSGGHFGRDRTYTTVARLFWWPRLHKHVARYVASCDVCQSIKAVASTQAPLQSLEVPSEPWESISMDFMAFAATDAATLAFGYALTGGRNTLWQSPSGQASQLSAFLFARVATRLNMSSADLPETDGQTECANRVVEDVLRSYAASKPRTWSSLLHQVEFPYNSSVHASTGFSPFYASRLRHPRLPTDTGVSTLSVGGISPGPRTTASIQEFLRL